MRKIHPAGLYEAIYDDDWTTIGGNNSAPAYQLRVTHNSGETTTMHDPYAFKP